VSNGKVLRNTGLNMIVALNLGIIIMNSSSSSSSSSSSRSTVRAP
jgi:hypothetical protein